MCGFHSFIQIRGAYIDNLNREFIYQYGTHKILCILGMVYLKKKNIINGRSMSVGANVYPYYNAYEAYLSQQGWMFCRVTR